MIRKERKERKKKLVWEHFTIEDKSVDKHPPVKCSYCLKEFKRGVPERMQAHLDYKCSNAPYNVKSQFGQQNTTSITGNFNDHTREKEQQSLEILLTEALSLAEISFSFVDNPLIIRFFKRLQTSFKLPNREKMEEIKMQMNNNTQSSLLKQTRIEITTGFYKEAEKGHINSIHALGECYYYYRETEEDDVIAFELYKEAAEKEWNRN
ncbi:ribonuclease H-like domain-containing protein [Rhizophagus irregularis DAOM 181602=DAOM 197198]|nr:ribonuclease H-like domain-containing protein [Rhizophagus irregularis DAOM 181602=DAOM 197198]CAB4492829.1 unnamed protein product [Rhizophagus irregularis]